MGIAFDRARNKEVREGFDGGKSQRGGKIEKQKTNNKFRHNMSDKTNLISV
jgi:hypothetical protein